MSRNSSIVIRSSCLPGGRSGRAGRPPSCRVRTEEEIADCRAPAVSNPALRQMMRPIVQHVAALTERAQIL
jgi:hypothetical protein